MDTSITSKPDEMNSKWRQNVLTAFAGASVTKIADIVGVDVSAASTVRSEKRNVSFRHALSILEALGFKCVPVDAVCVNRSRYEAIATLVTAAMSDPDISHKLIWDDGE